MSIHVEDLRDIADNHGWHVCNLAADEIEKLETENASLRTQLSAARAREAQLLTAFNFRQWTPEMDRAWHRAIPNVQKAFTDLLAAIDQARGK